MRRTHHKGLQGGIDLIINLKFLCKYIKYLFTCSIPYNIIDNTLCIRDILLYLFFKSIPEIRHNSGLLILFFVRIPDMMVINVSIFCMSSVHTSLKLNWLIESSEVLSSELCFTEQISFISLLIILTTSNITLSGVHDDVAVEKVNVV